MAFGGDPGTMLGQGQGGLSSGQAFSYLNALSPTHSLRLHPNPQDYLNAAAHRLGELQAGLVDSMALEGEKYHISMGLSVFWLIPGPMRSLKTGSLRLLFYFISFKSM
jgi:hypothetical protein